MDNRTILGLQLLELEFGSHKVASAIEAVKKFEVEIPSWIFGEFGGGRFGDYVPPGCARNISEKLQDAAFIHELTGATPQIAVHVLWDFLDENNKTSIVAAEKVNQVAIEKSIHIGSVSPTYFLKGSQRGSLSANETEIRERYIEQTHFAAEVAREFGNSLLTIWLPDGSLYPGQIELRQAFDTVRESLQEIYKNIDDDIKILIEYKLFEPGTYSTVIPDWGSAYVLAKSLGRNAGVLVDLGHHPHVTNIEQIVARLISEKMNCGFHFNSRYAADDDHSVEPNSELARIFYELISGDVITNNDPEKNWAFMIDQCSSRENRMHAILHSVESLQMSLAKAMLVDKKQLSKLQNQDEIILANRLFNNAIMNADVRPIVVAARLEKNLPADPIQAYVDSQYQQKIENERK
ncbi:L-rhamnose isomerase [candidate division KSB1 bacterium]|nr:L-rhamnose isomerase [candidate division KSB1 bacterium]